MEHNGSNPNIASATLCRAGCGFYGNAAFEGMCSKCYKDSVKRRQQNPTPTQVGSGRVSPAGPSASVSDVVSHHNLDAAIGSLSSASALSIVSSTTPSVDTATPTVPTASTTNKSGDKDAGAGGAESSGSGKDKDGPGEKKPKKNRCQSCKKKVGLTGFECRCGGLYCSLHRYSDKHECTFNYKEMAQEQIRKNNPVVVGEKIQKI